MSGDRYRFTVGDFDCLAIKDSTTTLDGETVFSNIDKATYKPLLKARGEKAKKIELSINTLAVFSDDWVLIDTGFGELGSNSGQVAEILEDEEIRLEHIILSHLHPDHYGGLISDNGDTPFGNVPVYICQSEWVMAKANDYAQEHLDQIERQIDPIECINMSEILPGLSVIQLPGHTHNHIGILIESRGEKLLFAGDSLGHPLHLEQLDWQFSYDSDHAMARESRIKLAELAIELDATVMLSHFAFPGLGKIEATGDSYRFVPHSE